MSSAKDVLARMWLVRVFEESVSELVGTGEVVGLVHVSIGQEASAVAVCDVLEPRDRLYSGHRAHGHVLARGADPAAEMAELMGRATGLCKGKGGSMHLVDVAHGMLGATGVVGGTIPLALGTALALRETEPGAVCAVFFGDGAVQTGYFHESLNIAALWKLPVLLVCENNGYAEFTPRSAHTPVERVTRHAETYGVAARTVDGNDVMGIREAAAALVTGIRSGGGPAVLECLTYRMRGHYEGDPARYREASEVEEWKAKDPVARFTRAALANGWLSAEDARECESEARRTVAAAVTAAKAAPFPSPSEVMEDVRG